MGIVVETNKEQHDSVDPGAVQHGSVWTEPELIVGENRESLREFSGGIHWPRPSNTQKAGSSFAHVDFRAFQFVRFPKTGWLTCETRAKQARVREMQPAPEQEETLLL